MRITSFTGVDSIDNVKIFKPVEKLFVKVVYDPMLDYDELTHSDPTVRVRLVDGRAGSSTEIVPEMKLSILSEVASKYEGFQRRSAFQLDKGKGRFIGFDLCTIIVGCEATGGGLTSVDLSNDKYLDIDMRGLNPKVKYEIWGFEGWNIAPYVRKYSKFYLSQGELEKKFSVSENEVLVFPVDHVKEIQFWAKNSDASPVYRKEEFILDEDGRNDLVSVELTDDNECVTQIIDLGEGPMLSVLPIKFGYSKYSVVNLRPFSSFEVRREGTNGTLMFLMIDTVPTI